MKRKTLTVLIAVVSGLACLLGLSGCISCYPRDEQGLYYEYKTASNGNGYYAVVGCGIDHSPDVIIPAEFREKPVAEIESGAFGSNPVESVYIPETVKRIGGGLGASDTLESITVSEENPVYESRGNCIIEKKTATVIAGCRASVVPDDGSVTKIGKNSFSGITSLQSFVIPDGVTEIGRNAFSGCKGLEEIVIGKGVREIGEYAFYGCESLKTVEIPEGVLQINYGAFSLCDKLESVTLPKSVAEIRDGAFRGCRRLLSVRLEGEMPKIDEKAFLDCDVLVLYCKGEKRENWGKEFCPIVWDCENNDVADDGYIYVFAGGARYVVKNDGATLSRAPVPLAEITVPERVEYNGNELKVTAIGRYAFADCARLARVTIPDGVTSIGAYAFKNCVRLKGITLPDGLSAIGNNAFDGSGLVSLELPKGLTSIGLEAFNGCRDFVLTVSPENEKFYCEGNCLIERATGTLTAGFADSVPPDGVKAIGRYAFSRCTELESVALPDSVTEIGENAFFLCDGLRRVALGQKTAKIGKNAFRGCSLLEEIVLPDSLTSIGEYAFASCGKLAEITVPDAVADIAENTFFGCTSVVNVKIGNGAASVGNLAFAGCKSLEKVVLGKSITVVGEKAFANCPNLQNVALPDGIAYMDYSAFAECNKLQFNEYENGLYLGNEENPYIVLMRAKDKQITSCAVNENTKIIYNGAFSGCALLTEVIIADGVTTIEKDAFEFCTGLSSLNIPESVTAIKRNAFSGCARLVIYCEAKEEPSGFEYLWDGMSFGSYPFKYCPAVFDRKNNDVGKDGFAYAEIDGIRYALKNGKAAIVPQKLSVSGDIVIPERVTRGGEEYTVTALREACFYGCFGITSLTLPDSVETIGDRAFYDCRGMTAITVSNKVSALGADVFGGSGVKEINYNGTMTEWKSILKNVFWEPSSNYVVHCTDGDVSK